MEYERNSPEDRLFRELLEVGLQILRRLTIIEEKQECLMSAITDFAAAEQISLNAISSTLDAIVAGVAALDTLITNLQNSPGTLSPSDQAALDQIQAASQALVTKAQAISVNPPAPPTPPSA